MDKVISAITHGYQSSLRSFLRFRLVAVVLFLAGLGLTYVVFQGVPKGFVPNEDQDWFLIAVQSPPGASTEYTRSIEDQVQAIMRKDPDIENIFAITGSGVAGNASNQGVIYAKLQDYSKRKGAEHSADAVVDRLRGQMFAISGAVVLPFLPPAVSGIGGLGGFQFELQDQGAHTLEELANVTQDLVRQGRFRNGMAWFIKTHNARGSPVPGTGFRGKDHKLHASPDVGP